MLRSSPFRRAIFLGLWKQIRRSIFCGQLQFSVEFIGFLKTLHRCTQHWAIDHLLASFPCNLHEVDYPLELDVKNLDEAPRLAYTLPFAFMILGSGFTAMPRWLRHRYLTQYLNVQKHQLSVSTRRAFKFLFCSWSVHQIEVAIHVNLLGNKARSINMD